MSDIIVWGTGQISQVLSYYLEKYTEYKIQAYCIDKEYITNKNFNEKPVIAFEDIEKKYPPNKYKMALIMGYKNLNKYREEKYQLAKEKGYSFISYVGPSCVCDGEIGENTFIFTLNNIQPFSKVGTNVIIWSHTCVGHHSIVDDNCFLACATIAGCTHIKKNCFIGANCTIADHVEIGEYSIIGAGSLVTKSVEDGTVIAAKQTKQLAIKSFDASGIFE